MTWESHQDYHCQSFESNHGVSFERERVSPGYFQLAGRFVRQMEQQAGEVEVERRPGPDSS